MGNTKQNNNLNDKRAKRLARNDVIRQRNRAQLAENENKPRQPMVTIVMSPTKDDASCPV
jgi:hypothetical protein